MRSCILASGSKGNCLFIEAGKTRILVDCGLTMKDTIARLESVNVEISTICAILVTHEHSDHCKGVGTISKKFNIPVYFYFDNYQNLNKACGGVNQELHRYYYLQNFKIGDIEITPFELPHDSYKNVGFSFTYNNQKVSIATDLGTVTLDTLSHLKQSTICYLEANHDLEMLSKNPRYSAVLKQRIKSNNGHLCNIDCAKAVVELAISGTKQVVLCHLSEENNTPLLAYTTVKNILNKNDIIEGKHIAVDVAMQQSVGTMFSLN